MEERQLKAKQPDRGRETMFRVTYRHQSNLIQIADYKANIIISVSTMIISAIIAIIGYGAVSGKIEDYGPEWIIPIVLIILTCLISLIFAIEAARPKLIRNRTKEASGQKSSLLFFGVIAEFSQQAYLEKIKSLLETGDDVYEHMTIDIYYQGLILKRKYNLLRYAYWVLMYGFIVSVLTFFGFFAYAF